MDTRLLSILVCPICKGNLNHDREQHELICPRDHLAFPIRDGMPIMLAEEARELDTREPSHNLVSTLPPAP